MELQRELLLLLAALLQYPRLDVRETTRRCVALMLMVGAGEPRPAVETLAGQPSVLAEASTPEDRDGMAPTSLMSQFAAFVESTSLGHLEEIYTATFDLNPVCCPYVGYHLFGNDPKRADLMVKLQQGYREAGIDVGSELPDHLSLLLRYLAHIDDPELGGELAGMLIGPALEKMASSLDGANPYALVVRSAERVVRHVVEVPHTSHSAPRTAEMGGDDRV